MSLHNTNQGARQPAALVPALAVAIGSLATFGLFGCGGEEFGDVREIASSRVATRPSHTPLASGTLLERSYGRERVAAARANSAGQGGAQAQPEAPLFDYQVPDGWQAKQPTQFRTINLGFKADPSAELYLTFLPSDGGGLVPNIDRWRSQVGLQPMDPANVGSLETRTVFGRTATYLELLGPFQGMTGGRIEDGGIFGVIFSQGGGTLFVKMTGPRAVLEAEREHFGEFLDSLRLNMPAEEPGQAGPSSPLLWQAPQGWTETPSTSQFREVTFTLGSVEMYISTARGGALGNISRWAGQLGLPPLDAAGLEALERVEMMEREAYIFEGKGSLKGMRDRVAKPGQMLLAALVEDGGLIVTVKATGPADEVEAARPAFLSVIASLEAR